MLPDWCQPILKAVTRRQPTPPTAHHVISRLDPSASAQAGSSHVGIGSGHVNIQNAGYNYTFHAKKVVNAATSGIPLWAKKAAIIGTACATPPLMLTAFASSTPAPPVLPTPSIPAASPTQVPEPGGILLMPFGVVAIVAAAKLGRRGSSGTTAS